MTIRDVIQLVRPEHWVKNLFIFLPAFFAARLSEPEVMFNALLGFTAFCLMASAVYVLNDMVDAVQDRNHPDKCKRPIASGAIQRWEAGVILGVLLLFSFLLPLFFKPEMLVFSALYFLINVAYSFSLKHLAIIDVSLIGLGFLLRVLAGGAVTGVAVSHWLMVLTFVLALILGLAKRRGEYVVNVSCCAGEEGRQGQGQGRGEAAEGGGPASSSSSLSGLGNQRQGIGQA
jgi:4-hydroxybenzoate polyprenyltransferase